MTDLMQFCSGCRAKLSEDARFCPRCGRATEREVVTPGREGGEVRFTCPECKAALSDPPRTSGGRFRCPNCSAAFSRQEGIAGEWNPSAGGNGRGFGKIAAITGAVLFGLVLLGILALEDEGGGELPVTTATPTAVPEPTAIAGVVSQLDQVEQAVVRIVAQGSFIDPDVGERFNVHGSGSGFIIDPSGIAVTNNHIVTGAATLQVYVTGESSPRRARVLGVSECSDLAVIDIDGAGFRYLDWFEGAVRPGLDVYAAGYPLGDPEFTLTRGIISKSNADGQSSWASVDGVVEHDATINPGNSGGPLIDSYARVVGINYATSITATNQFFAIRGDAARSVLRTLQEGRDVESIGVNGQAVIIDDGVSGVWVASVKTGSPADRAGVRAGDLITRLEGLLLATDGTMSDYCDILRTHLPEDQLAIEILRYATAEVYEGRINGDRPIQLAFSFAHLFENSAAVAETDVSYTYHQVADESGHLIMEIPAQWSDVDGSAWLFQGSEVGLKIEAAPSIADYHANWNVPGVFFGASDVLLDTYDELDWLDFARTQINLDTSCTYVGRDAYEDVAYTGFFDLWQECGVHDVVYVSIAATPPDRAFLIAVQVQIVTDADFEALDRIHRTFFVR